MKGKKLKAFFVTLDCVNSVSNIFVIAKTEKGAIGKLKKHYPEHTILLITELLTLN